MAKSAVAGFVCIVNSVIESKQTPPAQLSASERRQRANRVHTGQIGKLLTYRTCTLRLLTRP